MKLVVVAIGHKVPDWAQTAWDDYAKRFPPEIKLQLKALKTEPATAARGAVDLRAGASIDLISRLESSATVQGSLDTWGDLRIEAAKALLPGAA